MIVSEQKRKVDSMFSAVALFRAMLATDDEVGRDREHFWVAGLNTKNVVQYVELVHLGSLNACVVHPREIFRMAIVRGCNTIIACHNHPSDDVTPSQPDNECTRRLQQAGDILGIKLLDSLIIANNTEEFYSYGERNLL